MKPSFEWQQYTGSEQIWIAYKDRHGEWIVNLLPAYELSRGDYWKPYVPGEVPPVPPKEENEYDTNQTATIGYTGRV